MRLPSRCRCRRFRRLLPKLISSVLNWNAFFPPYLINYFKYPVILDGALFRETFGWKPKRNLNDIFSYYRKNKQLPRD